MCIIMLLLIYYDITHKWIKYVLHDEQKIFELKNKEQKQNGNKLNGVTV